MVRNGLVIVARIDRCYSLKFRSCCHFYHSHCHYKLLIICRLHEMLKMTATYNKTIFYIISVRIKIPKLVYPYLFSCKRKSVDILFCISTDLFKRCPKRIRTTTNRTKTSKICSKCHYSTFCYISKNTLSRFRLIILSISRCCK